MAALFSFQECGHCAEHHPVLSDGRMSIHFTRDGDQCVGSGRRADEADITAEEARVVEADLRRALNQVAIPCAS